ncbi:MAG TPA: Gfo/Idh/MocA family oxidoreductase, partial [Thermomicrobiales bacterium]|nr:Gfo/Idh/MocA family oxidoreductase [Thermomicrobiales bacterium]
MSVARRPADRLGVCLTGCGGMGRRHLTGYTALAAAGHLRADIVAVFDLRAEAAEALADEAERLLGRRPRVHTSLESALDDDAVDALDIVTDPRSHHAIALAAFASGRHVLSEKPIALTVRAGMAMVG